MKNKRLKMNLRIVASDEAGIRAALRAIADRPLESNELCQPPLCEGFEYDYEFVHSGNLFSKDGRRKVVTPSDGLCECCGSDGATFGAHPFASEIHGDETPVWMCADCRHQSMQDVK